MSETSLPRDYDRAPDQKRPVEIITGYLENNPYSVLIKVGKTKEEENRIAILQSEEETLEKNQNATDKINEAVRKIEHIFNTGSQENGLK